MEQMWMAGITPVLPIIASSCDAVDTSMGRVVLIACCDSNNSLFLKVPITAPLGATTYKWFALDKSASGYPDGTIINVACSISWLSGTGVMFQLIADDGDIHIYDPYTASNGQISYSWTEEVPPMVANPLLPNPWGAGPAKQFNNQ